MAPEDVPDEDESEDVGLDPDDDVFDRWAETLNEASS